MSYLVMRILEEDEPDFDPRSRRRPCEPKTSLAQSTEHTAIQASSSQSELKTTDKAELTVFAKFTISDGLISRLVKSLDRAIRA